VSSSVVFPAPETPLHIVSVERGLGRRYQETLVVESELVLADGGKVFRSGIWEYVECGKERFLV
jgi:hypothetical protein